MYLRNSVQHPYSGLKSTRPMQSDNQLKIKGINIAKNPKRKSLILLIESLSLLSGEVQSLVNGSRLVLEAAIESQFNRPLRTHLLDQENDPGYEFDDSIIGFTEIRLKPGYHYQISSSEVINPHLIKVSLNYSPYKTVRTHKN